MILRLFSLILATILAAASITAQKIEIFPRESQTRVDVEIDGKLFASYRWDERIRRPVLFPIMSAGGNYLTRGFPLETRDNETINHPHQVGSSLVYGDVNGIDFWNNSPFRTAKELEHMGRIILKSIVSTRAGVGRAELVTKSEWLHPTGEPMLQETTRFMFFVKGPIRWIDRETTLTAAAKDVVFGDNKEGFFAVHLNVQLQQDDQVPVKVTSASGIVSERTSKTGLSGKYFTSEGLIGNALWGTPAKWAAVAGRIGTEDITVAVFDSPTNLNYPSNMMVRPYGLLALNPFGQKAFNPEKPERKFTLQAKKSIRFQHRLLVSPGNLSAPALEEAYRAFAAK